MWLSVIKGSNEKHEYKLYLFLKCNSLQGGNSNGIKKESEEDKIYGKKLEGNQEDGRKRGSVKRKRRGKETEKGKSDRRCILVESGRRKDPTSTLG